MNALGTFQDFREFGALLHFSDEASEEVFGRMLEDVSAQADARLKALASGKLSPKERNYLLEELVGNPELLKRLAEHLREQLPNEHL
jgi:phage tail tape-measure protein